MATNKWRLDPHHRMASRRDSSPMHSSTSLPDEEDQNRRGFSVLRDDGKVVNAHERRSHAARVGHHRAINALSNRGHGPPHPAFEISATSKHQDSLIHLPLNVFPLKIEEQAKVAYIYYTEVYIPTSVQRTRFQGSTQDVSPIRDLIPFFLSDKVVFAAVLARAILEKALLSGNPSALSAEVTQAYGQALSLLRQHLISATDKVSDLVICALILLIAFDNLSNNPGSVHMHTTALKEAIACRGGPEKLSSNSWLATVSASLIVHNQFQQIPTTHNGKSVYSFQSLKPPDHPFSPRLCTLIAKLPPTFEKLCISERLLEPVIELLAQVGDWKDALYTSNAQKHTSRHLSRPARNLNQKNATISFVLMQNPYLPIRDKLVVMALKAYCALVEYTERGRFSPQAYLQSHAGRIQPALLAAVIKETRNGEWLTWVALLLLASSHEDAVTWSLGMRILNQQEPQQSWEERLFVCGKYFWRTDFSLLLLQKLQRRRAGPISAEADCMHDTKTP